MFTWRCVARSLYRLYEYIPLHLSTRVPADEERNSCSFAFFSLRLRKYKVFVIDKFTSFLPPLSPFPCISSLIPIHAIISTQNINWMPAIRCVRQCGMAVRITHRVHLLAKSYPLVSHNSCCLCLPCLLNSLPLLKLLASIYNTHMYVVRICICTTHTHYQLTYTTQHIYLSIDIILY